MKFTEFPLDDRLQEALPYMGFEKLSPIQEQAMPKILESRDILACAQTGTGKTAAFVLPILNDLAKQKTDKIDALILAPTRELAIQIDQQIQAFAYFVDVSSMSVYGGGDGLDFEQEKKALKSGADIIVATPGKFISHLNLGHVDLSGLKYFVLDEADRMLDMGFIEDINRIVAKLPNDRQTLLFCATMPDKIRKLSKTILNKPYEVSIAISKPAKGVLQAAYVVYENQKAELIRGLIKEKENYESILIFSSTKKKVKEIVNSLSGQSYQVRAISSDLVQKDREKALQKFRSKETRVLVATDVMARGIDIKDINLVINYDVPRDAEDYVHRIGRTARADRTGVAITLINEEDMYRFVRIERLIEQEVMKIPLPERLGKGPVWNNSPKPRSNKRGRNFKPGRKGRKSRKRY